MDTDDADAIRFYFSFRSPYAWLAAERIEEELGDLGVALDCIPVFPTPEQFPNDPSLLPQKVAYLAQDVRRIARKEGLTVTFPSQGDCDWLPSHAAALGALRAGKGLELVRQLFRQRFQQGLDLGEDKVLADASRRARCDPEATLAWAHDPDLRREVGDGWARGVERDGIFGVPSFVVGRKLYWGQDRMAFVRQAARRKGP
ncbi:MAG: DsbA family protein [Myxococcota bacterium]